MGEGRRGEFFSNHLSQDNFSFRLNLLDNSGEILDFKFSDGTPVWLHLRFLLRLKYMESQTLVGSSSKKTVSPSSAKVELLKYIGHAFLNNPFNIKHRPDLVSIANYEGNPECPNRMTVFLNEMTELNRAELLYSPRFLRFSDLKNTYSFDYFYLNALLKAKLFRTSNSSDFMQNLNTLFGRVEEDLGVMLSKQVLNELKSQIIRINLFTVHYRRVVSKWLKKMQPKLLVCSEGNNGDWRHGILFNEACKLGIPTAEVQHGIFNIGMKYGQKLAENPEFASFKSSHLFTFGPFHCSQTNVPSICIPLGHYHLEQEVKKMQGKVHKKDGKLKILFIGEGNPPSALNNGLIKATEQALREIRFPFRLVVRLHPSEGPDDKYTGLLQFPDSRYSEFKAEGIHALLAEADIVITHASTVIYEALFFNKPTLVLHDANTDQYVPSGVGVRFKDGNELLLKLTNCTESTDANDDYWATGDVVSNFRAFFKQL